MHRNHCVILFTQREKGRERGRGMETKGHILDHLLILCLFDPRPGSSPSRSKHGLGYSVSTSCAAPAKSLRVDGGELPE